MLQRLLNWLWGKSRASDPYDAEQEEAWHDEKTAYFEALMGPEHDQVMHAIIPYAIGGGLDLYYYPHGITGTGIATKELTDWRRGGPTNSLYDGYELVMFTKQALDLDNAQNSDTAFGAIHATINAVLNLLARYSEEAELNPGETCEFPEEMQDVGGKCLVFDAYPPANNPGPRGLGLLLAIEIHRSEMEYAMHNSGAQLLALLKKQNHYPYSDLDRQPVV